MSVRSFEKVTGELTMRNDYREKECFLGSPVDLVSVGGDKNFNDASLLICVIFLNSALSKYIRRCIRSQILIHDYELIRSLI